MSYQTPLGLYIRALFVDHHQNKPPSLEDIATFYIHKYFHLSPRLKSKSHLIQNILHFCPDNSTTDTTSQ